MATLFPPEILSFSPSRKDGVNEEVEKLHRIYGCELIQEAGILLKLPQVVMISGQITLHRYFYRRSLQKDDAFTVAMGCILLASKIEEKPKILREIILVFYYVYQKRNKLKTKNMVLGGAKYTQWKDALQTIERVMLKELGFTFYNTIEHPHKYIIYIVNMLDGPENLAQKAWNYLNDSMRLDLILRYSEEVIACSTVFMAARFLRIQLPDDETCPWWNLFVADITIIYNICGLILELYEFPKLSWLTPIHIPEYLSAEFSSIFDAVSPDIKEIPDNERLNNAILSGNQVDGTNKESDNKKQGAYVHVGRGNSREGRRNRESRERRGSSRDRRRDNSRDRDRDTERRRDNSRDRDRGREKRNSSRDRDRRRDRADSSAGTMKADLNRSRSRST